MTDILVEAANGLDRMASVSGIIPVRDEVVLEKVRLGGVNVVLHSTDFIREGNKVNATPIRN